MASDNKPGKENQQSPEDRQADLLQEMLRRMEKLSQALAEQAAHNQLVAREKPEAAVELQERLGEFERLLKRRGGNPTAREESAE